MQHLTQILRFYKQYYPIQKHFINKMIYLIIFVTFKNDKCDDCIYMFCIYNFFFVLYLIPSSCSSVKQTANTTGVGLIKCKRSSFVNHFVYVHNRCSHIFISEYIILMSLFCQYISSVCTIFLKLFHCS